MDKQIQLYEQDATGWQRGLYEDIKTTFRAPIVNWFFRTLMANEPDFTRYMWGQIKPLFQTRAFGNYTVSYRDAVLSPIEESQQNIPHYRPADFDIRPAEWRELTGQLATFDIVAPRLALMFAVCDRLMNGESLDSDPVGMPATAPLPAWIDRDRGSAVTMVDEDDLSADLLQTVDEIRDFHGFDDEFPSIYRCLSQWPSYLESAWDDLTPVFESDAFEQGHNKTDLILETFLEDLPYTPQLSPAALTEQGFDESTIADLQQFVGAFNGHSLKTVLQAVVLYAETLTVAGERSL